MPATKWTDVELMDEIRERIISRLPHREIANLIAEALKNGDNTVSVADVEMMTDTAIESAIHGVIWENMKVQHTAG